LIVIGIDAHMRSHTVVAVDAGTGRQLEELTVRADEAGHRRLLEFAGRLDAQREWAIEDCRNLSRHLEAALLRAGERVRRVPPKLMSGARKSARTYGKSDPIDALAVARAALREADLPEAHLDEQALEIRLLLDHREDLVAERTRMINRLHWHLHDLEITLPAGQALNRIATLNRLREQIGRRAGGVRAEIAAELIERIITLTRRVGQLKRRIETQIQPLAPHLLALPGCAGLTAAKILAETAGVDRFRSPAAFAMHAGTAPIPVWTGNRARFRLNRGGNRQLNAALHRIAVTQLRIHPPAQALVQRRLAAGNTKTEALRVLRRHLADVVYHRLHASIGSLTPCHQDAA
jgi:transposase